MTSANVIEYTIEKNGVKVGHFRKNVLCKLPDYADLLKYLPLNEHIITPWGYNEEEEYWEAEPEDLETFLREMIKYNKLIKEYFEKNA
jgi:hypothetical protein